MIIKYKGEIYNIKYIKENWEIGFHGTRHNVLESIMRNGLLPSGTKINGKEIKPPSHHIPLNTKVAGFSNWARAIFVSPSIFYAGHDAYSERINSSKEWYSVIIEVRVKLNCYTSHDFTVLRDVKIDGEPSKLEYRIEVKDNSNIIMRVGSEKNVIVTSILFAKNEFLENIKNYYEGDIYVNSDEERKLFMTYE